MPKTTAEAKNTNRINIDKEKIEKEIIKNVKKETKQELKEELNTEVKEEVMEDLLLIIDKETKNKLDKVEHKIYHYKNMSIFRKIVIIIILLLIVILETKVLYDHNLIPYIQNKNIVPVNNIDNKEEPIIKEESTIIKTKEWYIDNYSYLLNNIKTDLIEENKYYLYESNYKELTIKNPVRLNMAYQLLDNNSIKEENNVLTVSNEDLKESYRKVFGTTTNYNENNFSTNCIQFFYDSTTNNYMAINTTCEESKTELKEHINNIYEEGDNIIIETVVGVYNKDTNKLSKIDGTEVLDSFTEENNLEDYIDLLDTYKYTFKNIDNEYYFSSIEKLTNN